MDPFEEGPPLEDEPKELPGEHGQGTGHGHGGGGGGDHDDHEESHARHPEKHGDGGHGEPWLVSYADMMTLLFGFFVLMYVFASSTPEQKEKIKQQVAEFAGAQYTTQFKEVADNLKLKVKEIDVEGQVDILDTMEGVKIVSKGTLFFDSGSFILNPKAQELMQEIAKALLARSKDFRIIVEGHTDDSPIALPTIPSNWELSSLRAGTVVRIFESMGLERTNLRALGIADTEPLLPNRDAQNNPIPANQAENRRIVIHVTK
jgi:chemotaxis protein MotB